MIKLKYIKYKTAKTLQEMENIIIYDHQLHDEDFPKETLIPLADTDPLVAWIKHISKGKLKFNSKSILVVDVVLYYPCSNTSQDIIRQWKEDCITYISNKFGSDNIMTATYHNTEIPHIHLAVIPVNKDWLCWSHYSQKDIVRIPSFEFDYINEIL